MIAMLVIIVQTLELLFPSLVGMELIVLKEGLMRHGALQVSIVLLRLLFK